MTLLTKMAMAKSARIGLAIGALMLAAPSFAADRLEGGASISSATAKVVPIGLGKSYVVDLPRDASEVLVADPKIANAVVRSARRAYIIGSAIGDTSIIFFDKNGEQILGLEVSVGRDLTPLRSSLRTSLTDGKVAAVAVGDSVMLTGSVKTADDARTAADVAARMVGDEKKVVNALSIENRDQIVLKVSVVEMQRSIAKQFGIDWRGQANIGDTGIALATSNPFAVNGKALSEGLGRTFSGGKGCTYTDKAGESMKEFFDPSKYSPLKGCTVLDAQIRAYEQNGLLRTLAEPTLTAISGEKAEFLAGGEFPVPVGQQDGQIAISFKKYGVGLAFTPVVLSEGRISMQISTEVSELTQEGAVVLKTGTSTSLSIPGLKVRRANTTVELPSGGSIAMAGLLRDETRQAAAGLPGLLNLPVLGTLFKSRDYLQGQSELVVIVTPFIAKPVARNKLAQPDDGFRVSTDAQAIFMNRLNKTYSPTRGDKPAGYSGPLGYILD